MFPFLFILGIYILIYLKLGNDQKSTDNENSDDILKIVNCSPSAELSVNKVEEEKFETNLISLR